MDKRQSLVPIAVLLGALALLLACSRFTNVPSTVSPTAPPLRFGDWWPGWDRAADIVTVFGFPLAVLAVGIAAYEQYRVAQELRRRPIIVFGFESSRDEVTRKLAIWGTETTLSVEYPEGEDYSEPAHLLIIAGNLGDKIATHILWNIEFPIEVGIEAGSSGSEDRIILTDTQILIPNCASLNPQDASLMNFFIRVPITMRTISIKASVSSSETIDYVVDLVVNVVAS